MTPLPHPPPPPWYAKGLRFTCTACGGCCTGAPGYVWVTETEIRRIAAAKGMSPEAFSKRYVRKVDDALSLTEEKNGDCSMLVNGKCSVHAVKPRQCVTYPFWPLVLADEKNWEAESKECPGMNSGDLYTRAEIDLLRKGVTAPMREKQAAAVAATNGDPRPAAGVTEETWAAAFKDLERVYADLDAELPRHKFVCQASGDCCDFDAFGHRLYVTTLEAEYFFRNSPRQRANQNPSHCPAWGSDRLCKARQGRMLGCRTFFCSPSKSADPNEVYERYYRRVKEIHDRHGIPFRYADITAWASERRPA